MIGQEKLKLCGGILQHNGPSACFGANPLRGIIATDRPMTWPASDHLEKGSQSSQPSQL